MTLNNTFKSQYSVSNSSLGKSIMFLGGKLLNYYLIWTLSDRRCSQNREDW